MCKSSQKRLSVKPKKPRADFPLFPHATRRWAKKIRGRLHYFGPWEDPEGALQRYLEQEDDLHAGRTPQVSPDALTLRVLLNRFLTGKRHLVGTGEITRRTFLDYRATCQRIGEVFGLARLVDDLGAADFERLRASLGRTRGPVALGNEITRVRVVFKYAYDAGLIDKPVRYGPTFKRPSKQILGKARNGNRPGLFEPGQIRRMLDAAPVQLRAMILLAVNCGFGNADVGTLPRRALDLKGGWASYPRRKTGIQRRCPLWGETVAALREALAARPEPKNKAGWGLVFLTRRGLPWAKDTSANPISRECRKLLEQLDIYRPGLGFYTFRHVFQTVGERARDPIATRAIMGYAEHSGDMSAVYREPVDDDRLRAVTDHIHRWLFGDY